MLNFSVKLINRFQCKFRYLFAIQKYRFSSLEDEKQEPLRSLDTIKTIDCKFMGRGNVAASYLIQEKDKCAFIEANTSKSVPLLLEALSESGYSGDQVQYIVPTHVHLDHAGGVSKLLNYCPNAKVLVHSNGYKHIVDPSQLIRGAISVYGEDVLNEYYGEIARVEVVNDNEIRLLGEGRPLHFYYTRGHADHHFVVYDRYSKSIFTGDSFGVSYRSLLRKYFRYPLGNRPISSFLNVDPFTDGMRDLIFPSTSPNGFNWAEAHKSIDKIRISGAQRAYLTHGGVWEDLNAAALQLHSALHEYEDIVCELVYMMLESQKYRKDQSVEDCLKFAEYKIRKIFHRSLTQHGYNLDYEKELFEIFDNDIEINAKGLIVCAQRLLAGKLEIPGYVIPKL